MVKRLEKTCRRVMFCAAPVGVAPSAYLDLVGLPSASEARLLIVAVGIFLAIGYAAFRIWGRSTTSQEGGEPQFVAALAA